MISFEKDLCGKVVVITGAGGVLCGEMSKSLSKYGIKVAVLDLNMQAAQTVADAIIAEGGDAIAVCVDVLNKDSIKKAHDVVLSKYGPCDVLINGAGGNSPRATTDVEFFTPEDLGKTAEQCKTFFNLDLKGIEFVFDLNFMGTLLVTQEFAKDLTDKGGSIINISSMNAFTPLTKIPAYSAAKAGISNFTQWLAVHFAKTNIRVNAIAPGFLATAQNKALLFKEDGSLTERSKKIMRNTPKERFGTPDELIGAVLFFIDEKASSFITGVVLPIDGGFSAYSGV